MSRQRCKTTKGCHTGMPVAWWSALLLLLLGAASASAGEISGHVQLVTPTGKSIQERARILVHYTPDGASPQLEVPREPFELTMARKQFQPSSMIVPVGSTVRFPNEDTILHNVFSVSGRNKFDLGLYRRGAGKETTFEHPGVVRVYCNVHHSMVAHVVVVDTPFYGKTDPQGNFKLQGLPEGKGTLTLWFERSDPWRQEVTVTSATKLDVDLVVTKSKLPPHRNKFNQPYKRRSRGRAYN